MKKGVLLMTLSSVLFIGCTKNQIDPIVTEDLSYLKTTYTRNDNGDYVRKTQTQYDGNKVIGYQEWRDDEKVVERKNYVYDGLNAQWDIYYYGNNSNGGHVRDHVECEFLDDSYSRTKYSKTECYYEDSQNDYIIEAFYEYDGKKIVGYRSFNNGRLESENCDYKYDDLRCTYQNKYYSLTGEVGYINDYSIMYLDDTYLRRKSYMYTRTFTNGNPRTYYYVYEYDGKKVIGIHSYLNGELNVVHRDYQYDGLMCHYKMDHYRDGVVYQTTEAEVHYLK